MSLVKKTLRRFGYIHEDDLAFKDVHVDVPEKEEVNRIFNEMAKIDGIMQYLKSAQLGDIKRYFAASTPLQQLEIRGMYLRTKYFEGRIQRASQRNTRPQKAKTRLANSRYAA